MSRRQLRPARPGTLSVYLAKYGSCAAETARRFQFQAQAYNFLVVVLTAAIVASATLLGSGHGAQFERLILVLPPGCGAVGLPLPEQ